MGNGGLLARRREAGAGRCPGDEEVVLLRSIGVWRTVLARLRADWAVVAGAWLLLICATTLLTAGILYADTVALGGLRSAVAAAPAVDRAVIARTTTVAAAVAALDGPVRAELQRVVGPTGGEVAEVIRTDPFTVAGSDTTSVTTLITIASIQGADHHAALVAGRWASAGAAPQEATLSEGAAAALGLAVGDRVSLTGRLDSAVTVDVTIVGIWRPDPDDPYWLGAPQELQGITELGAFNQIGPLIVPEADLSSRPFGPRRMVEWRAISRVDGLSLDSLDAVRAAADVAPSRLAAALPAVQLRTETNLQVILAAVARTALVSRAGVLLLVVQFAVLAAYAIILVAGMLADRRRAETALLRSRGASSGHLAAMTLFEAAILAGTAAAIAPLLAVGVVAWLTSTGPLASSGLVPTLAVSGDMFLVDAITAVACVGALLVPMLGGVPNLAGVRASIARQAGRTLAQRLGLDLALVVVAGIGLWQLRLYGAPLTRNTRGVLGVDPLLVAAPGIGLLAGAVVATRLIPRLAELAERFLERGRGLVGAMGGRGLARRPLRTTRSALLLMLAAALGTFATAHVATWTRSQADQAAYQVGADIRVTPSQRSLPAMVLGSTLRALAGAEGVMPVDRLTVDSGRGVRAAPLLAVDAAVGAGIVKATADADGRAIPSLLGELAAARPAPEGAVLPDGTRQIEVVLDTAFEETFLDPELTPDDLTRFQGIFVSVVVSDGDGRLYRVASSDQGVLLGVGQSVRVKLPAGTSGPLRLRAIELGIGAPPAVGITGSVEIAGLRVSTVESDPPDGTSWAPIGVGPADKTWSWGVVIGSAPVEPLKPVAGAPWRIAIGQPGPGVGPVFGGSGIDTLLRLSVTASREPVNVIAGRRFLEATGASVGDIVSAGLGAGRQNVRVIGVVDSFPTLDPAMPFLVVDGPTLLRDHFLVDGSTSNPQEWWLASSDPGATSAAITAGLDPAAITLTRAGVTQELLSDPVPLGEIGVLGLGSIAAMLFAAIGFVVAATVSTRERLGEFALLRALGLSAGQLSLWLWVEHAFLLVIGVTAGLALGVVLAFVVLPVSTLTATGATPTPIPIVEVPVGAFLPVIAVAAVVFLLTMVVLRRLLLQVQVSDVLRGRDE